MPTKPGQLHFRQEWISIDAPYIAQAMKGVVQWPPDALFDLLALAQHHGLPTRLLDWSRRAHVAAYFAATDAVRLDREKELQDRRRNASAPYEPKRLAVWALDLEARGLFKELEAIRVPGSTSRNIAPQEGLFTLLREPMQRGVRYEPRHLVTYFRERFAHDPKGCPLSQITVPWSEAPAILDRCDQNGISGAILFPGYDGAAKATLDSLYRFERTQAAINRTGGPK